jgi:hypothetical protein
MYHYFASDLQSTTHQTIHFRVGTAYISRALRANIELQAYNVACY